MEDETKNGVLNLDEMLGEKKLIVRLRDKEYQIRTVKSLSPEEFGRVMAYGTMFTELTDADIGQDNGAAVMKVIDDLIEIIAPTLPRYKPTWRKWLSREKTYHRFAISLRDAIAIMQFWAENNHQSKNALRAVKPSTKKKVS